MALQKISSNKNSEPTVPPALKIAITFFQKEKPLPFIAEAVMGKIEIGVKGLRMKELDPGI